MLPVLALAACGGSSNTTTGGAGGAGGAGTGGSMTVTDAGIDAPDPNGPWTFTETTADPLVPVWGGMAAQASPTVAYLAGGVSSLVGPVLGKAFRVEQGAAGVTVTQVSAAITPRYCGCAMVDEKRGELLLIGGRDGSFNEISTAEIVNLATGTAAPIDPGEAAAHPVGCHAVFLADRDEGYVFGGAGQTAGFGSSVYRYDPAAHSFTKLTVSGGPPARYDGVFRYPSPGGALWLTGGMGIEGGKAKFYSDVWKFDPAATAWTEVSVIGAAPPGRRMPWVAFSPDQGTLIYGFGSDSPMGQTFLGDLWKLDVTAGTWAEVPRMDPQPDPRGFALWLPGPAGSVGLLSGGLGKKGVVKTPLVIQSPTTDVVWR